MYITATLTHKYFDLTRFVDVLLSFCFSLAYLVMQLDLPTIQAHRGRSAKASVKSDMQISYEMALYLLVMRIHVHQLTVSL